MDDRIENVGELRRILEEFPDDLPVRLARLRNNGEISIMEISTVDVLNRFGNEIMLGIFN
jgi:hypothetical protein